SYQAGEHLDAIGSGAYSLAEFFGWFEDDQKSQQPSLLLLLRPALRVEGRSGDGLPRSSHLVSEQVPETGHRSFPCGRIGGRFLLRRLQSAFMQTTEAMI